MQSWEQFWERFLSTTNVHSAKELPQKLLPKLPPKLPPKLRGRRFREVFGRLLPKLLSKLPPRLARSSKVNSGSSVRPASWAVLGESCTPNCCPNGIQNCSRHCFHGKLSHVDSVSRVALEEVGATCFWESRS